MCYTYREKVTHEGVCPRHSGHSRKRNTRLRKPQNMKWRNFPESPERVWNFTRRGVEQSIGWTQKLNIGGAQKIHGTKTKTLRRDLPSAWWTKWARI